MPGLDKCQERQTSRRSGKQWVCNGRNAVLSAVRDENRRGSTAIAMATEDLPQGLQKELAKPKSRSWQTQSGSLS